MLLISPHKDAPLFSAPDWELKLTQVIDEISGGNFSTHEEIRQIFRQASLVNLWFFIKFVCGHSAPVDRLNTGYHLDLCNFYMKHSGAGDRAFVFLPRGHLKSKICTIHGTNWDLIRDPNLTIKIFNAKEEFAFKFMQQIQRVFDSNPFFKWLFPEFVPEKGKRRWNNHELELPNRTVQGNEANVEAGGITGASEGKHYKRLKPDDIFGMKALNSQMEAGAIMESAKNWFKTATSSLLDGVMKSSVFGAGTRWSSDDGYEEIWTDCNKIVGEDHGDYVTDVKNTWSIFYMPAIINNQPIFEEDYPIEFFENLSEKDPWSYATQYMNQPSKSGLAELADYEVEDFKLVYDEHLGYKFVYEDGETLMSSCDNIQVCDPAASEKKATAKTSRSALGILSHAPDDKRFLFNVKADFVPITTVYQWGRKDKIRFKCYLRCWILEAQGAFKILGDVFRTLENLDNKGKGINQIVYLNIRPVPKIGEKDAVIRSTCEPILSKGLLFVEKKSKLLFMEELKTFPHGKKKDILDMLSLGLNNTSRPPTEEEIVYQNIRKDEFSQRRVGITGY